MSKGLGRGHVVLALLISACSGNSANGSGSESDVAGFKSSEASDVVAGAGVTNLLTLRFVAPSDGVASVIATGSCSVSAPLPVASLLVAQIETEPSDATNHPGDATFTIGRFGEEPSDGAFSTLRTLPVTAGEHAVFLNLDNPSSGGMLYCSAVMTVLFSRQELAPKAGSSHSPARRRWG